MVGFLMHHQKGHWAFSKGHSNEGELPKEAARRELFDETGLEIERFLPFSPVEENYIFQTENSSIDKQVLYFLAEVMGSIVLQIQEIQEGDWFLLRDAEEQITFPQGKAVCKQVCAYFRST